MVESTQNLQLVCEVFRRYARKIARKNNPHDPNFLKISITLGRIEQFIESIFPSQQPPVDKKAPATIEEAERKRKEDSEANWDLVYIVAAVIGTVLVITFFMLFVAWLCGARFDIAYEQFKMEFGKLMGVMGLDKTPQPVTEVHETLNKSEL